MQQDYQVIPLKSIKPDPNQPRKFFSESEMQELTDSIRSEGVIQPILVRPKGKGYMLVCGERRYRASLAVQALHKDRNTIPCMVREISDAKALDLQIIENLQRKDVHPMEEAASISKMIERGDKVEEIAEKIGKSTSYVVKRAKLNDLVKDAQELFFAGKMTITVAIQMARLEPEIQTEILEDELPKDWRKKLDKVSVIDDIDYYVRNNSVNISRATFKANDAKIYPEAGACTDCPFNTANQPVLFDDMNNQKLCTRPSCFQVKEKRAKMAKFEKVASDPSVLCVVTDSYLTSDEQKDLEFAEEAGIKVLDKKLYERVSEPGGLMSFEDWFEINDEEYEPIDDEAEVLEYSESELARARKDYEKECEEDKRHIEQYEADLASGKILKAFVVAGGNSGKYVKIRLKSDHAKTTADAITGNSGDADILNEISKIEQREIRNKELDGEKVWAAIREQLLSNERLFTEDLLKEIGVTAFVAAIRESLSYTAKRKADTYLEDAHGKVGNNVIAYMSRLLIIDKLPTAYGSHLKDDSNNQLAYRYIKDILPEEVSEIESKQQEVASARAERVQKRIESLRKKLSNDYQ
ncbi:MAG TPA: ParB/RepB/Spo0J family partition protein [Ferruginibacter sp.]|nr:ParB/RepB/Spo0J family partition protein [Ferruginibacter sp.]